MKDYHKFHIPVMGTAFTAETPLRVAQFGINSVVSIVDDVLLERLRKVYCESNGYIYDEITNENINHRADRITSYLNLINKLTTKKFEEFINSTKEKFEDIEKYFSLLPNSSEIKKEFYKIKTQAKDLGFYLKIINITNYLHQVYLIHHRKVPNLYEQFSIHFQLQSKPMKPWYYTVLHLRNYHVYKIHQHRK